MEIGPRDLKLKCRTKITTRFTHVFEDLDDADVVFLSYHIAKDVQDKINMLQPVNYKVSTIGNIIIKETEEFTYLGSTVRHDSGINNRSQIK